MIEFKNSIGNIVKVYAETFEQEAFDQIKRLSNFKPYINSNIRIMPDAHAGKGCTVGTTMTINDNITPNLVGVDIGCGMLSVKLLETDIDFQKLDYIINEHIPNGFSVHSSPIGVFDLSNLRCGEHVDLNRASLSLGSLGGGNHFIEVSRSENDGSLYLIIHSGSRKLGGDTCKYYQNKAIKNQYGDDNRKNIIEKLKKEGRQKEIGKILSSIKKPTINKELAYLSGNDFNDYLNDMDIVQGYARANREAIADIIIREAGLTPSYQFQTIHNYIDVENMILRKGAVSAVNGERLLIPINMRDGSLLCIGRGNPDWNYSAPHGAGRLMSRSKAKGTLSLDEFKETMVDVYSTSVCQSTLDEAPDAYKSIDEIMRSIGETVDVIDTLKPMYNFKAH